MPKILVVDDKTDIRELMSDILLDEGYEVLQASNASIAIKKFDELRPSLVILDIWLEGSDMDGIGLLKRFKSCIPEIPIIMISGHGNIETAVQTIKHGAYDFIEKPFKAERLLLLVKRALELATLQEEIKGFTVMEHHNRGFIGKTKSILQLMELVRQAAQTNSRVLITGENGTGKGTAAKIIHSLSSRKTMPYATVHAHAHESRDKFLEKELFGVDNGQEFKPGKLERANGGTIFIDEVANISEDCQLMLLKFLQEGIFHRIGSQTSMRSDIRFICSSTHELNKMQSFNQNLLYRLNVVSIHMPPLRERKDDIEIIIDDIAAELEFMLGLPKPILSTEVIAHLQAYNWPGNIRQLRNIIEGMMILKGRNREEITLQDLPRDITRAGDSALSGLSNNLISRPLKPARDLFEAEYLKAQLSRFSGNISKTAEFIGMDRTALYRKLKSLKIANN